MNRSIDQLLKEGKHYDNDIKIMALNDLSNKLTDECDKIDSSIQNEICDIFLHHLDATSIDVQSNAIRCIGNCIGKIQETNLINLLEKLTKHLLQANNQTKQIRDIYATCIKTIINKVPEKFGEIICNSILKNCFDGLKNINDVLLEEEIIEIISNVLKNFSVFLYTFNNQYLKNDFSKYLLQKVNIRHETLRKKCCTCLGLLTQILSNSHVQNLAQTLIKDIKDCKEEKTKLLNVQFLSSITKFVANKLNSNLTSIIPFVINECQSYTKFNEKDDVDILNECLEHYLNILEQFVKACPKDIQNYLHNILEIATFFLKHDPNSVVNIEGEGIEIEDEDEDNYDEYDFTNDDSSWRVRRASIHIINTLLKQKKDMIKEISNICILELVKRLREKDENVRLDTFMALSDYFKAIVYGDISNVYNALDESLPLIRMKSSVNDAVDIIDQLIQELLIILKGNNSNSIKTKSSNLLLIASLCVPNVFLNRKKWIDIFTNFKIILEKNDSNLNEIKINILMCLRRLFRSSHESNFDHQENFEDIAKICKSAILNNYFKISAEGFRLLSSFFKVLRPNYSFSPIHYNNYVIEFVPLIISKLKEADIDQDIKHSVIQNSSVLIHVFGDQLNSNELKILLEHLLQKIKNEVTRFTVLKAFQKLSNPSELKLAIDAGVINIITQIIQELCGFLLKQSRTLKISALESLLVFIELLKGNLNQNLQKEIIMNIYQNIKDEDFYLAQLSLQLLILILLENPKIPDFNLVIDNCIKLSFSPLVQGAILNKLLEVFEKLAQLKLIDENQIISKLLQGQNKNSMNSISKCIAAIIIHTPNEQIRKEFIELCQKNIRINSPDVTNTQNFLFIIREIGKITDFSTNDNLVHAILENLNSKIDGIKNSASLALGGITLGNPDFFLPKVLKLIETPDNREFLILNTLREIIQESQDISKNLINLVPFLFKYAENKDESIRNFVAECVGKICLLKFDEVKTWLQENLSSENISRQYTAICAFRHFCTKSFNSDKIRDLIPHLFKLVHHSDINLRKAVMNSLSAVAYNAPKLFKEANSKFYEQMKENLKIIPELIKEVELGPFKHKVDDGLPLRISSYSFIEISVETLLPIHSIDNNIFIEAVLNGLDEIHDDILVICFHIIQKLCLVNHWIILSIVESIIDKLKLKIEKLLKNINSKQEGDRNSDLLRAIVRCFISISKIPEIETTPKFCDYFNELQKNAPIIDIIKSLQIN